MYIFNPKKSPIGHQYILSYRPTLLKSSKNQKMTLYTRFDAMKNSILSGNLKLKEKMAINIQLWRLHKNKITGISNYIKKLDVFRKYRFFGVFGVPVQTRARKGPRFFEKSGPWPSRVRTRTGPQFFKPKSPDPDRTGPDLVRTRTQSEPQIFLKFSM